MTTGPLVTSQLVCDVTINRCNSDVWCVGTPRAPPGPVPPRRVAELRSTNRSHPSQSLTYSYNTCFQFGFVQYSDLVRPGQSRDPFGAATNIRNSLPEFPICYTATLSPILFFRLPSTILKFQVLKHLYTISSYGV